MVLPENQPQQLSSYLWPITNVIHPPHARLFRKPWWASTNFFLFYFQEPLVASDDHLIQKLLDTWYNLLGDYSKRSPTSQDDKLVVISWIANIAEKSFTIRLLCYHIPITPFAGLTLVAVKHRNSSQPVTPRFPAIFIPGTLIAYRQLSRALYYALYTNKSLENQTLQKSSA